MEEAVWAYTVGAAYAGGTESSQGSITPGKFADLAVLSQGYFHDPADGDIGDGRGGDSIWRCVCVGGVFRLVIENSF